MRLTGPNDPNWSQAQRAHAEGWYAHEGGGECVEECPRCGAEYDPVEFEDGCPYCEAKEPERDDAV